MTLNQFIALFPLLEPPFTLTDESIFSLSRENRQINSETAHQHIAAWEPDYVEDDETEYIPCMRLDIQKDIISLIYWRAKALSYEYFLVNLDKTGQMIDRRLIGGLVAKDDQIVRIYVSVDADYIFYVAAQHDTHHSDPSTSAETYALEVMPTGEIIAS